MRSYGQFCAVARALDQIGDRWTLLIVRELLIRESARYSDLLAGLPGIATNLLANRLDDLEANELVERVAARPPVSTTLFRLTDRGRALEPVLAALGRWGGPLLRSPRPREVFRTHWLTLPARWHLTDLDPSARPVSLALHTGDEPMVIELANGVIRTSMGSTDSADAVLTGPPHVILGLLSGSLSIAESRAAGVHCQGDMKVVKRVRMKTGLSEVQS